jgi:DNA (cytosine-5)-methyltransferase 1
MPIEMLPLGLHVLTHERRYRPITQLHQRLASEFVRVQDRSGHLDVLATPEHPFYCLDTSSGQVVWVDAADLVPSRHHVAQQLNDHAMRFEPITSVERVHTPKPTPVYNIAVDEDESYVVCRGGATVHNCQDVSVAGQRAGMAAESGTRSALWWEVVRILDETRSEWFIGENVPGLLSSRGGRDMGAVLGSLGDLGYRWAYRVLDAQHFGVPQRRRRVFIVARRSRGLGPSPAEILFEREGLRRDFVPSIPSWADATTTTRAGVETRTWVKSRNAQSNTDWETWRQSDVSRTLNAFENASDGRATVAITGTCPIQDGRGLVKHQNGFGVGSETDPSYTLDATGGQAVATHATVIGRADTSSPQGPGHGSVMLTLDTVGPHGVAHPVSFYTTGGSMSGFARQDGVSVTLTVGSGLGIPSPAGVVADAVARRLLPIECERLQGLPDDHTRYRAGGIEQSDSQRYKQIGNGLAVPVLSWILAGLAGDLH